jgi:glycosyltransferase involved in cell wall biosynthesis
MTKRGTLLIFSQVYIPDPASAGQHIADAAEESARRGWRVVVYTSARGYDNPSIRYPKREVIRGVEVRRLPLSSFGKGSLLIRLIAQSCYMTQAVLYGTFLRDLRLVMVSTNPPFVGLGGTIVSWLRRAPLVWWVMDMNPDQLVATGTLKPRSLPVRIFDWFNRLTLRQSRDIVALDRFMGDRLVSKEPVASKLHIMPPWPHDDVLSRRPSRPNPFRDEQGFGDSLVIMYSGNHALQHSLETLLDAAKRFESDPRILFVFVGGGVGKSRVQRRIDQGATNIRSLPYQPLAKLGDSLSAADIHVVSMGDEVVGIVHPCKIYGAMFVARPILFFGPEESHVGDIMKRYPIGRMVRHGDVDAAVAAISDLAAMSPAGRAALGDRAAEVAANEFSREELLGQFCDVLDRPDRAPSRSPRTA